MAPDSSPFAGFVAKLGRNRALSAAAQNALFSLPHSLRSYEPTSYLFGVGEPASHCWVLLSGFACRHKMVASGSRQILGLYMRGDAMGLENALMPVSDCSIQALTSVRVAAVPVVAMSALIEGNGEIARAIWLDTLLDGSIQREWTVNVGRRDARARIAHILCEIGIRQEAAGIGRRDDFELPLTQEQLADCAGLTAVHVNRVLRGLKEEGIITNRHRRIEVPDWERLIVAGDFSSARAGAGNCPRSA